MQYLSYSAGRGGLRAKLPMWQKCAVRADYGLSYCRAGRAACQEMRSGAG